MDEEPRKIFKPGNGLRRFVFEKYNYSRCVEDIWEECETGEQLREYFKIQEKRAKGFVLGKVLQISKETEPTGYNM